MVPALIIHGGAGAAPEEAEQHRVGCRQALLAGWAILTEGGSAVDAVEVAVRAMESNPLFNAGYGGVLTSAGTIELDASIMEGAKLRAGAVGAVSGVRHPIALARLLLEEDRHVLLVGEGALAFARERGFPLCRPEELITERQRKRLEAWRRRPVAAGGTVGAVAIDRRGLVAAGTSTGGMTGKAPGRVGDSALIGAGTYADNRLGGASATGDGEAITRAVLAKSALEILRELDDPEIAAQVAMDVLREDGRGHGGVILMDWRGRVGHAHTTPFMPVAWLTPANPSPVIPF